MTERAGNAAGRLTTPHNGPLSPGQVEGGPSPEQSARSGQTPGPFLQAAKGSRGSDARQAQQQSRRQQPDLGQWWLGTQHRLQPEYTVYMLANPTFNGLNFSVCPPPCWKMEIKASLGFSEDEITDAVVRTQQVLAVPGSASSFHSWSQGGVSFWRLPSA